VVLPPRSQLELAGLGARLRDAGLTARALAAWAGTARIAGLPALLAEMPARPPTPAAAILALLVGGAEVTRERLRGRAAVVDELIACKLVDDHGDQLRARVAIVPLGAALLVCDRLDAPNDRALVCWPDDSSHHLATAIPPGRRADWLDLGCGSAFAALARPELAPRIVGVDINERAVRYAQLGAGLSGISHLAPTLGDVGTAHEPAELVTCNAPIPDPPRMDWPGAAAPPGATLSDEAKPTRADPPRVNLSPSVAPLAARAAVWWRAEPGFFDRLWPALRRAVRPGGMIVVHAASEAVLPVLAEARGERVVVTYTPAEVRGFAIAWWRPDGPDRFVAAHRALTPDRPHLEARDREEVLAG
jgi:SAM-dependent methyltransferase